MKDYGKLRVAIVLVLVFTAVLVIQTIGMAQVIPEPSEDPSTDPEPDCGGIWRWLFCIILMILLWFQGHLG